MLVLSRKPNQEIHLPDLDVSIRVLSTKNGSVKIGIQAPSDIRVLRGELNDFGKDSFCSENHADSWSFV